MTSHNAAPAVTQPFTHPCTQQDLLEKINEKLDIIIERLARGDTAIALHDHRISELEKAGKGQGYGITAVNALIFWAVPIIGGGILYSIFKSGGIPGAHP
jgi:hypothetical protein